MGPVVIIYLILLGGSIVLTIIAGQRATKTPNSNWNTGSTNRFVQPTYDPQPGDATTNARVLRFGGQNVSLDDLKANYVHQPTSDSKRTLADTLRQLEDAHKQGLIDSDEYGHLRQEALDKLV